MITNNLMKRPNGKETFIVQLDKMERHLLASLERLLQLGWENM
jgi:hypothetical protein